MTVRFLSLLVALTAFSQASYSGTIGTSPSTFLAATPADDRPMPPGSGDDQPTPVGQVKFDDLKNVFVKGLAPTEQNLVGDWAQSAYADVDLAFAHKKNCYGTSGCANGDGSILSMRYAWIKNPVSGANDFSAKYLNWGDKGSNMGPYAARISIDRKAAVSSVYASGGTKQSYFTLDCRQLANDSNRLICGVTLHVAPNEPVNPDQARYDGVMGGMILFDRVK